ncbi:uncharacterized protein LOC133201616 [Saccostrea echinata]|uniref:uncharacterized protein LOC133201616 n=1 Tax=Saccostrea echinata TaxID=191078 RepID=UPI002A81D8E8|nr:uncharacterized protein LOC133201616 [Saccostrea echinata]
MLKSCQTTPYTDQCGNIGILWNCSGFHIDRLPLEIPDELLSRNVTLDLSFNRFSTLNESIFENLANMSVVTSIILNHNNITKIGSKTFHALTDLCSLDISYCHLNYDSIGVDVFSHLPIKYLKIDHNNFKREHMYPDVALSALQSLCSLEIDVFKNFEFTTPFENLTSLSELKFNIQSDFRLSNTSFLGLKSSKIKHLNLTFANHVYCDVNEDLFCSFPYLTDVIINFGGKCDVTPALRSLKCLQHRNINNITLYENKKKIETDVIILNDKLLEHAVNICVRKFFLIENNIAAITKNIHSTTLWNCLQELDLSKNDLHVVDVSVLASWFLAPKLKKLNYCCNDPYRVKSSFADIVQYYYRGTAYINLTLPEKLEEDYAWIIRYLYPKLESLNINAWFKDKDSVPGTWEAEEIVKCINESRKVLFVITGCFLESGWASFAVQMAITHAFHNHRQSSIVVIINDNIPLEKLPNDIKNIWWCIEYLRWPTESENDDSIIAKLSNLLKPRDA